MGEPWNPISSSPLFCIRQENDEPPRIRVCVCVVFPVVDDVAQMQAGRWNIYVDDEWVASVTFAERTVPNASVTFDLTSDAYHAS